MKRWIAGLCLLTAGTVSWAEVVDIGHAELVRLMSQGVPVIDIRTPTEWKETGLLQGSHPLTFYDERGNSNPKDWLAKAAAIAKPGDPVILICRSGNRSKNAAEFLSQKSGYARVYNAVGGLQAWTKAGQSTVQAAPIIAGCKATNTC